ncbi:superfamily II DNA or RNA helicase [Haloferula luteola]|uniref:Superfamily II DNA or RNA helicase n=1 Tax=Haloferula luteola TaxID=595692 RepID=A0A840VB09_9BACT|nr:DEAD/DEAH box helicase [Haloferula luteola]MBB5350989.1 superfamily II DNA or RNA helicase [Haloferula luteola]
MLDSRRGDRYPVRPPVPEPIDIHDHFSASLWQDRFEEEILLIANKLKGKARGLQGHWENESFVLHAEVAGESCEILHWREGDRWDFESTCTCDIRTYCPHAAAALLAASKPSKLRDLLAPPATPPQPPVDASHSSSAIRHEGNATFHLRITREPTDSKVVRLLLQALKIHDTGEWVVARPEILYGDHRIPLGGKAGMREHPLPDGSLLVRDPAAEMNAILQLQQTGLASLASHAQFRFLLALEGKSRPTPQDLPPASTLWFPNPSHGTLDQFWPWLRATGVESLQTAGWTVNFDAEVGHEVISVDPEGFKYVLEDDGTGWFHLSVGFDVNGSQLDLMPILAQLLDRGATEVTLEFPADGSFLHHLDDGRALKLPADRIRRILKQFAAFLDPRRFKGSKLRLHPLDAATLAHNDPEKFNPPPKLEQLIHSLSTGLEAAPGTRATPDGLQAELRDYQRDGFHWMQFLAANSLHGILADDMGLGKTLQTLTHILAEKEAGRMNGRPALVVAPTSVVPNWLAEARKFAPTLRPLVLEGPQRKKYFRSIPYADLVLTSFALLQRDIEKLRGFSYHLVILDEAQHIKNPAAKVAKAACDLDGRHRLCLSGTPVENHLGELWSQMRFLMPGFLGTQEDFNRRFRKPIENEGNDERQAALKARVAPLILRRTKDQVAKELPPKTILVHPVELNTAQKDLYETVRATMDKRVRQAIAIKGLEGSRMLFLEALLKLRQICCEPKLLKFENESKLEADAAGSAKLDYLADLLDTLVEEGRRILLFSQFTSMLDIIAAHLESRNIRYLMLTGSSKNRGELVERFQTGEIPLFLISLKAGGTGLNLTAADTVIHYDPWWNPAAEAQATDRAYRIGQKNPVFVHKLICQGTVEERIHQLQAKKSELADALLADAAKAAAPDAQLLSNLLAPLG